LPGVGSFIATALPCILAAIDIRKTPTQVLLALILQSVDPICIEYLIEPVFFGMSAEIHSVIIILGVWFFHQVWGWSGMLLSVPLLAVLRLLLKSLKHANQTNSGSGEDADAIVLLDNILEGRWMSTVGAADSGDVELELHDLSVYNSSKELPLPPNSEGDPDALRDALQQKHDVWEYLVESSYIKAARLFYQRHMLAVDTTLLLLVVVVLLFLPL